MLNVYLKISEGGKLQREHISAWIYRKLSKRYHDSGIETYSNGSGVKAHSFYFDYNKDLSVGDLECIEIRGIQVIENKLKAEILVGEEVYLGKVRGSVYLLEEEDYTSKRIYKIKSPLVMRYLERGSVQEEGYPVLLPSMGKAKWEKVVRDSIELRASKIWGDSVESDLLGIRLFNEREVRSQLNIKGQKMVYGSVIGMVEIDGSDFWQDFIQRVGLGNRNTYGFGVIG
jgi:CRISPR/Cas system endoribonuclease Cas6 (RAMP superfamily)